MRMTSVRTSVVALLSLATFFSAIGVSFASHHCGVDVWAYTDSNGVVFGEPVDLSFLARFSVFEDDTTIGTIQVRVDDGASLIYRVVAGTWLGERESETEFALILVPVDSEGEPTGDVVTATATPSSRDGAFRHRYLIFAHNNTVPVAEVVAQTAIRFRDVDPDR